MSVRLIAMTVIVLSFYLNPAVSQENCTPGDAQCNARAQSPQQNPFYLFPWMANTAPSISANINSQGDVRRVDECAVDDDGESFYECPDR